MVDFAPAGGRTSRQHRNAVDGRLLCAGPPHRRLCAEFSRSHDFNVLIEPIKKEFTLSAPTMGLLAASVSCCSYHCSGSRSRRVADRLNRRNIVAWRCVWSAMTFLCGMASSVATLALAESASASANPPAPRHRNRWSRISLTRTSGARARCLCHRHLFGVFLGYFIGGYVNQHYGWRMAFFSGRPARHRRLLRLMADDLRAKRGRHAETFRPNRSGRRSASRLATDLRRRLIGFA